MDMNNVEYISLNTHRDATTGRLYVFTNYYQEKHCWIYAELAVEVGLAVEAEVDAVTGAVGVELLTTTGQTNSQLGPVGLTQEPSVHCVAC